MLGRAGNQAPEGSPLRQDLQEVREIAQSTVEQYSQPLAGAAPRVARRKPGWKVRWTGIFLPWNVKQVFASITKNPVNLSHRNWCRGSFVSHHPGSLEQRQSSRCCNRAWIRLRFLPNALALEVEDHGKGFVSEPSSAGENVPRGIGLVAMRERAELIGGILNISRPSQGGTLVQLKISQDKLQPHAA